MAYHNKGHAKNKLDKVQVMYKGNQFFLIDNINIDIEAGEFIGIMCVSLIIEGIFGIPGVGPLYVSSITTTPPDYNFFMLLSAFYTFIGLAAKILVDISYGFIDPRIRVGER